LGFLPHSLGTQKETAKWSSPAVKSDNLYDSFTFRTTAEEGNVRGDGKYDRGRAWHILRQCIRIYID